MTAIAQLELVRNEKEEALKLLTDKRDMELEAALKSLFEGPANEIGLIQEGVELEFTESRVSLKVAKEGYFRNPADVRFQKWYGEPMQFEFSGYSTSDVVSAILIGKFAQVAEKVSDKAVETLEGIKNAHKEILVAANNEVRELNRAIRELERAVAAKEKEQALNKLKSAEGVSFDLPEDYWKQPKLTIRFDCEVNNVTNLKVVGQTASGKSLKVEITQKWSDVNGNERLNVRKETVRATNVENFLKEANKYVAA